MARDLWLSISLLLLVGVPPAVAEINPELWLEITVPDSVNIANEMEIRDVNGDGYSELLILNANPIVTYSLKENRVLDFFRYATDGLTRRYRAAYIDADERLDVAEAVLIPGDNGDTFAVICRYGADAYLTSDTIYSISGLDTSRSYTIDKLYFADANADGQVELYTQYYYMVETWDDPWAHEPSRYYYYSPLIYNFESSTISVPSQLPLDLSPFYSSASGDDNVQSIAVWPHSLYIPAYHGRGTTRSSSFSMVVEGAAGDTTTRFFGCIISCANDHGTYNDYSYGASLKAVTAGDILPDKPGIEVLMRIFYHYYVTGPISDCGTKADRLVMFNIQEPANWATMTDNMNCDTAIEQLFFDPRFESGFLSLSKGTFRLHNATTFEVSDQSTARLPGSWVGYVTLQAGEPQVAVFRNGRTFQFYSLSQIPTSGGNEPGVMLPDQFTLGRPYPNPFNPTVTIPLSVDHKGRLRVEVFNPLGQRVTTLHDAIASPGEVVLSWDATAFGSGVYLIKATLGEEIKTVKAVLVK